MRVPGIFFSPVLTPLTPGASSLQAVPSGFDSVPDFVCGLAHPGDCYIESGDGSGGSGLKSELVGIQLRRIKENPASVTSDDLAWIKAQIERANETGEALEGYLKVLEAIITAPAADMEFRHMAEMASYDLRDARYAFFETHYKASSLEAAMSDLNDFAAAARFIDVALLVHFILQTHLLPELEQKDFTILVPLFAHRQVLVRYAAVANIVEHIDVDRDFVKFVWSHQKGVFQIDLKVLDIYTDLERTTILHTIAYFSKAGVREAGTMVQSAIAQLPDAGLREECLREYEKFLGLL